MIVKFYIINFTNEGKPHKAGANHISGGRHAARSRSAQPSLARRSVFHPGDRRGAAPEVELADRHRELADFSGLALVQPLQGKVEQRLDGLGAVLVPVYRDVVHLLDEVLRQPNVNHRAGFFHRAPP